MPFAWSLILVGLLCGCAGYQLGPSNGLTARAQSVYVEPFVNGTLQPGLEDSLTRALRLGFQREGTYRLGNKRTADVVVAGRIQGYDRQGLSYDSGDLVRVKDYNLVMSVQVTARESATGRTLLDKAVAGETQVRSGENLLSAETPVSPLLAEDVAKRIVDLLTDGDW